MNVTVADRRPDTSSQTQLGIVDCDVHPYTKSPADLDQFLPERWRKHRQEIGSRVAFAVLQRAELSAHVAVHRHADRTPIRRTARIPAPTCR